MIAATLRIGAGTFVLVFGLSSLAQAGCPGAGEATCQVALGEYHVLLPNTPRDEDIPAIMFLHGWRSDGGNVLSNDALGSTIPERGYALIAPNGSTSPTDRSGGGWVFREGHDPRRDEAAFLAEVAQDAAARFGIDRGRIVLSGFSIGGSMASYIACAEPDLFAAYAPLSGGFWRPHPETCAGPVRLFHTHGWTDQTVPLEGRYLRNGTIAQGDIFTTLEIWRATNGCDAMRADAFDVSDGYWRRSWTRCTEGSALVFALFPGGHTIPKDWANMVLDWIESGPAD